MLRKLPRPAIVTSSVTALLLGFAGAGLISEAGAENHASKAAQASAPSELAAAAITADRVGHAARSSRSVEAREAVPQALSQALNTQNAQSAALAEQKAQQRAEAEAAARKAAEEAARRKAAEEEAARKAAEEAARRKAAEKAAAQEAARKAAAEEAARKKAAEAPDCVRPVSGYRITAGFGNSGSRWASTHTGLDFAAASGTKVRSVGTGKIIFAGWDGAYGNKIAVRHTNGTVTWYAHLSKFERSVGSRVDAGSVIGRVGSTGNSTGPHLHLEVRPGGGSPVNPRTWLADHGVKV